MMFNKNMFKKINDKKVLHKIGKRWVTVSAIVLGLLGGGAVATTGVSHAASTKPATKTTAVAPQKQNDQSNMQITINPDGLPSTPKNMTNNEVTAAMNSKNGVVDHYTNTKQAQEDNATLESNNAAQASEDNANEQSASASDNSESTSDANTASQENTEESIGASADDAVHTAFQNDIKSNEAQGFTPSMAAQAISPSKVNSTYSSAAENENKALSSATSAASASAQPNSNSQSQSSLTMGNIIEFFHDLGSDLNSDLASDEPKSSHKIQLQSVVPVKQTSANTSKATNNKAKNANVNKKADHTYAKRISRPKNARKVMSLKGDWLYNNVLGGRKHHVSNIHRGQVARVIKFFSVHFKGAKKAYLRLEVKLGHHNYFMTGNKKFAKLFK